MPFGFQYWEMCCFEDDEKTYLYLHVECKQSKTNIENRKDIEKFPVANNLTI